ncbi:MAG: c-type cytochrome [Crocinitomix sp.]|nr:c-type cytochrome [Crocinitomix sp.]
MKKGLYIFISGIILLSCGIIKQSDSGEISAYELEIPKGFPEPLIPEANALTQARVDLGRMLFFDPILSIDSSISCASCHDQSLAFADNRAITPGVEGRLAMRNAPTLANVVYNPTFLFDGHLKTLEMQILVPIGEHAEMAFNIVEISKLLQKDSTYVRMSYAAYNRKPDPFVITRAISTFERILISGNSKYDQQAYQGKNVLNKSEKRGMDLFFNQLNCAECHSGFNFTNYTTVNNGLYEVYADSGRQRVTKLESDRALFKVPTLRNISLTAPYMHDGSIATLEEVIAHYKTGGVQHKNKSDKLKPFELSDSETADLIHFLNCLTDKSFLKNKEFRNPFE